MRCLIINATPIAPFEEQLARIGHEAAFCQSVAACLEIMRQGASPCVFLNLDRCASNYRELLQHISDLRERQEQALVCGFTTLPPVVAQIETLISAELLDDVVALPAPDHLLRLRLAAIERHAARYARLHEEFSRVTDTHEQRTRTEQALRERMEDALKKGWDYLEQLNNSLGDAIFTVNLPEQQIDYVNHAVENIFGYTADECIGRHTRRLFRNRRHYHEFVEKLRQAFQANTPILRTEHQLKRKQGGTFTAEITATFLREGEALARIITIVRDITDRKQMELALEQERASLERKVAERTAELRRNNDELQASLARERELNTLKTRFLSIASHEFRTPLSSIQFSANLLKRWSRANVSPELAAELHEEVESIEKAVVSMTASLNEVLAISKAEMGQFRFSPKEIDVAELCQKIVERFHDMSAETHRVEFFSENGRVPARVDPKLMENILSNLLSNAVKYSPQGGAVACRLAAQERQIILSVSDQGIGISPEDQRRLFTPFYRGENAGQIQGTGLGLSIVKQFVELHGGTISVQSGQPGTTFTVTLPAQHDER